MDTNSLVGGAVQGLLFAIVALAIPRFTRWLLALALVGAAAAYLWFAFDARAGVAWLAVELVALAVYGTAALRGVRGSAWWLAGAWALHPLWDVVLHHAGPGAAFAPEWYTVSCLTFDLAVAGYTAIAILIGTHLSEAPAASSAQARPALVTGCGCGSTSCTATAARAA